MFTLTDTIEVDWPVKVAVPVDGGRHEARAFTARFRILPQEELDRALGPADGGDEDFLARVLVGWDKVADEAGDPVAFSDEARKRLVSVTYVRRALVEAYFEAATGGRRKN